MKKLIIAIALVSSFAANATGGGGGTQEPMVRCEEGGEIVRLSVCTKRQAEAQGESSHSGGTNKLGCHTDKQSGVYHCH